MQRISLIKSLFYKIDELEERINKLEIRLEETRRLTDSAHAECFPQGYGR